jgi:hypothetical protein
MASDMFSAGTPLGVNGKSLVKPNGGAFSNTNTPRFMFLAISTSLEGPGVVDVIDLESGTQRFDTDPFKAGVQSIKADGVRVLMDYFRQ